MPSHFITNHLFSQTNTFTKYIYYKQPQYSGEEFNQFHFFCCTDYKHFWADEQHMLITTTGPSILPIYSCFQNIFSAYTVFDKVQSQA